MKKRQSLKRSTRIRWLKSFDLLIYIIFIHTTYLRETNIYKHYTKLTNLPKKMSQLVGFLRLFHLHDHVSHVLFTHVSGDANHSQRLGKMKLSTQQQLNRETYRDTYAYWLNSSRLKWETAIEYYGREHMLHITFMRHL